ncbi:ABC transporter permease [Tahibacter amnicola]|uniref:Transport permease protein n=1 Tax=Tahibacter amnicola TaxID=2976241 RepID=A0ABY6BHY5_9GAMM|nr:ABC transporter permease [Tahibacter amnicola]UXI69211.1 ABC transporter permease [Tahibacter amnicola]
MSRGVSGLAAILTEPFSAFGRHRSLTLELAKRDVLGRYRGASFGLLWSVLSPFLMLMVYTLAFGSIFNSRWPQQAEGSVDYTLILFVGLIVHGFFAECLSRAPNLVVGNPSYVKRVVFPLEILPWPMLLSAYFHALMNGLVFVALYLARFGPPPWTVVLAPLVLLPLALLGAGVGWLFASLAVYLRDISQVTGVLATALLFLSSALIPVETLPPEYQFVFRANPLTFIIDQMRAVALWGQLPDWWGLGVYAGASLVFCYVAYSWFRTTRPGFADVL